MTTFALVSAIILIILALAILATLVVLIVLARNIINSAKQMRGQVQPVIDSAKQLRDTGMKLAGTARRSANEIKDEAMEVKDSIAHRAGNVAWLYRQVIVAPIAGWFRRLVEIPGGERARPGAVRTITPPKTGETIVIKPDEPPLVIVEEEPLRPAA